VHRGEYRATDLRADAGWPQCRALHLGNDHGVEAGIMNYGGTLVSLRAPDRNGAHADVVLGFNEFAPSLSQHPYFGFLIGRYANRIAGASFTIAGKTYRLSANG
jgi:aldose 1-epimerase